MKYLILGASSFYGSNFAKCVREHGDEVILFSRPEYDFGKMDWIVVGIHKFKPDCVVNFASKSLVAESWEDPESWMLVNGLQTTELIHCLHEMKIDKFIHVSTPEVYGHTPSVVREGHPFNPSTPYAVSRAAADMMLMAYHKAYGFPAIITRTANIYGLGQPEHRFIPKAFRTLREGKKLYLDGGGQTVRGFLHIKDACEATYLLSKEGKTGETYHIAPQGVLTIEALAMLICNQLGMDASERLVQRPDRLGKDTAYILDSNKLRSLGWHDRISLKEGLSEYGNHSSLS